MLRVPSVKIETRAKGSVSDADLASHCGPLAVATTRTRGRDVRMEGFMLVASVKHEFTSPALESAPKVHQLSIVLAEVRLIFSAPAAANSASDETSRLLGNRC